MNQYREQWAGWRRIAVDKGSAANHRWILDYKITFQSLEDQPNRPVLVPTIGLRKDGHAGKAAEGMASRVIAGFYDAQLVQWVFLEIQNGSIEHGEAGFVQVDRPSYEVSIYGKGHSLQDSCGYSELEQAMKDFVSRTQYEYQHHNPMDWFDVVDKQSSSTRVIPEGYGAWA